MVLEVQVKYMEKEMQEFLVCYTNTFYVGGYVQRLGFTKIISHFEYYLKKLCELGNIDIESVFNVYDKFFNEYLFAD